MSKKGEKICIPEDAPITEDERKQLDHIYATMGDRVKEAHMDELILLRFVRGYVNEEDPAGIAYDTIDKCLTWRKEKEVDKIAATEIPRREEFIRLWPHGMHGVTRDGHVIYIDRPGQVDPSKLHSSFTMDEYLHIHIQTMEWMNDAKIKLSQILGRRTYKHAVIMDLEGFGFSHFSKKFYGPIKELIDIDQTKYPETLHKMYVVNPSFMVKAIWAICSPWIDKTTQSRIKWCKDVKELLEDIDADQLPDFLGGTCVYTAQNPAFVGNFKTGPMPPLPRDEKKEKERKKMSPEALAADDAAAAAALAAAKEAHEAKVSYDGIFQNFLEERQALMVKWADEAIAAARIEGAGPVEAAAPEAAAAEGEAAAAPESAATEDKEKDAATETA